MVQPRPRLPIQPIPSFPSLKKKFVVKTVDAIEYGSVDIPVAELLDDKGHVDIHPDLVGRDFIDVRLKKKALQVFAGGYVGIIPLNSRLAIRVNARVPVANLTRILRIANFVPLSLEQYGRDYVASPDEMPDLFEVYARSLAKLVEPLRTFGLMRDYVRVSAASDVPRGRITMSASVTQRALMGLSARVETNWFERTVDTPANRCIKFALWLLAKRIGVKAGRQGSRATLRKLNAAYGIFEGVRLDQRLPLSFLSDPLVSAKRQLPSSRSYYRDPLRLSAMVASGLDVALDRVGADLKMMPLLINMDDVFESYMREVLRSSEPFSPDDLRILDGNRNEGRKLLFDREPSSHAQPDILVSHRDQREGRALVVADVKYKPASGPRPDRADLNQVITYGATYRAPRVLVIQPRGPKSKHVGLKFLGRISELQVFQYVFDLSASDLLTEEQSFAAAVASLLGGDEGPLSTSGPT
jgi:5-methylcytosine-specific restriction enzyme subunit McrC